MAYLLEVSESCASDIRKQCKKNPVLRTAVEKKINQILEMSNHFKPLHSPLQNKRRVHIMNCFVLIYEIIKETQTVRLLKFSHHDDAY